MTLTSGHPIVIVDGTRFDGEADCGDDGLRAYLKTTFNLPEDVIEDCNGSELLLSHPAVVGQTVGGRFYLYWGSPIKEASFILKGMVESDDSATALRVLPSNIRAI